MKSFQEIVEENFEQLDLYTTAITRAHGKSHPEAFDVREIFEQMNGKVQEADESELNLTKEFNQLRKVTNNYDVPSGVCGTYSDTYKMLYEADQAYQRDY